MGSIDYYHATMIIRAEEELAIRTMFEDKDWPCYLKVLSVETVADIIASGFSHVFPVLDSEQRTFSENVVDFKSEVKHEDDSAEDSKNVKMKTDDDITDSDDKLDQDLNKSAKFVPPRKSRRRKTSILQDTVEKQTYRVSKRRGKSKAQKDVRGNQYVIQCADCGLKFDSSEDFWSHRNFVKHQLPTVNIPTKYNLAAYSQEEHESMGFIKCDGCDNYFLGKRRQMKHFYVVHRDLMPTPTCPICCKEFKYYAELLKHKREEGHRDSLSSLNNYQCDLCGKHMTSYSNFVQHRQFVCGIGEKEMEKIRVHDCDICGKLFKSPRHVRRHKKISHFKVPEMCDICGTLCQGRKALDVHKKRHDEKNKRHVCDDCGKAFFSDSKLQEHIRTHTKEKPFKCPLCTYTCAVKPNIHKHAMNVHKQTVSAVDLRKMPAGARSNASENSGSVGELAGNLQANSETFVNLKPMQVGHVNNEIGQKPADSYHTNLNEFKANSNVLNNGKMDNLTVEKYQLNIEEKCVSSHMIHTNSMSLNVPHKTNPINYNVNGLNTNMQIDCNGSDIVYYSDREEKRADFLAYPHTDMYNISQYQQLKAHNVSQY